MKNTLEDREMVRAAMLTHTGILLSRARSALRPGRDPGEAKCWMNEAMRCHAMYADMLASETE